MSKFFSVIGRDLRMSLRRVGDLVSVLMFLIITLSLFPFGIGAQTELLSQVAPGIIWVTVLLSVTITLERLFSADLEDGSLDLLLLSGLAAEWLALAKIIAHWLITCLPIVILSPVLGLLMRLPVEGTLYLMLALLVGTPILSFTGAIGGALSLGSRRGAILIPLLIMPLYIPTLIFGVGAVEAAIGGFPTAQRLIITLLCLLLIAIPVGAFATASALRQAVR